VGIQPAAPENGMSSDGSLQSVLILAFLCLSLSIALVNHFTVRRFDQYPLAKVLPRVSVLVPARNEEANIAACVSSLLAQDYPDFEVIVLDDGSSDRTPDILARLLRQEPRLKVLDGTPLPEGWLGKHWACRQLDLAATGELLLFVDADTRHTPDMLTASVSALQAESADLVSAFPHEEVLSLGERLLVPIICWGTFTFIPIRLVARLRLASLSVTIGQFMLFRRSAYEAVGGFEAVKAETVDDMQLGRRIINAGLEWRLLDGTRHVSCRMYRSYRQAVEGLSKTLFAVFDHRILPYFGGWLVVGVAFLQPVVTLVSRWLRHPLTRMPVEHATAAVVLSILLWMFAFKRFKFPPYLVFIYPLSLVLFLGVVLRSFLQAALGTAVWKDRVLEKVSLRWL
jgi:chlorobactene glucosyltransferase